MGKIIVTVAPVASQSKYIYKNPLSPSEIAADVIAAAEAGASMVHLHVRDEKGHLSNDISSFSKTLDIIKENSNIIVQGSTGGLSSLSLEERCIAINDPRVEVASLNMGSVNMYEEVFVNTFSDIIYWSKRLKERNVLPELEIFELGMINNFLMLRNEDILTPPYYFNFTVGIRGTQPAMAKNIFYFKNSIPDDSIWGFVHHGMNDLSLLATAIGMGASIIRCGFEDSIYYAPNKKGKDNNTIVKHVVHMIRSIGYQVATPDEARLILSLA